MPLLNPLGPIKQTRCDVDTFGDDKAATEKPIRMALPPRALNSIEIYVEGQLGGVQAATCPPPPFVEVGDGDDYDGMSLRDAIDMRDMLLLDAEKVFRRQIIIARELGPNREDGGPFVSEYENACLAEGVNPWPVGDPMIHERK